MSLMMCVVLAQSVEHPPKFDKPVRLRVGGQLIDSRTSGLPGPMVHDVDGDGVRDLVVGQFVRHQHRDPAPQSSQIRLMVYRNSGTDAVPSFAEPWPLEVSKGREWITLPGLSTVYPTFADLDSDGIEDLIEARVRPSGVLKHPGLSPGRFDRSRELRDDAGNPLELMLCNSIQAVDLDSDHDIDLVVGTRRSFVGWFRNTGSERRPKWGTTPVALRTAQGEAISGEQVCVADWDLDGCLDLVLSTAGAVSWRAGGMGEEGLAFGERQVLIEPSFQGIPEGVDPVRPVTLVKPHVVDWDLDGLPDLLLGNHVVCPGRFRVLEPGEEAEKERILEEVNRSLEVWRLLVHKPEGEEGEASNAAQELEEGIAEMLESLEKYRTDEPEFHAWVWLYRRASK